MTAGWRAATVVAAHDETPTARTLRLRVDELGEVQAGQHVDVRLTADDGYQAVRSYSLSAVPPAFASGSWLLPDEVELTVEELPEGEVSPYLVRGAEPGDPLEVRGPIGGFFVWRPSSGGQADGPVQLVGGGSGVAPLMAMLRARAASESEAEFRMLVSVRTPADVYFRSELATLEADAAVRVDTVFTRVAPADAVRPPGRLDPALLEALVLPPEVRPTVFVCGPNGFVETVATALVALGHDPARVRTERFGGA